MLCCVSVLSVYSVYQCLYQTIIHSVRHTLHREMAGCCQRLTLVHLLSFLLLLLHIVLGVVPLATGHIHHVSTFFQSLLCPNTTYDDTTVSSYNVSCSEVELLLSQLVVPYLQGVNLLLLVCNAALLTCGVGLVWCNVLYIIVQIVSMCQVLALGVFVIFLQQLLGLEVSTGYNTNKVIWKESRL